MSCGEKNKGQYPIEGRMPSIRGSHGEQAKESIIKMDRMKALKADLHLHTAEDPVDRVRYTAKELIAKAADEGFDVISITNHQQMTFNQDLFFYAKERDILLIPGMEMTIQKRHVLVLNPPLNKVCSDFFSLSKLRRPETLIVAPHPFSRDQPP